MGAYEVRLVDTETKRKVGDMEGFIPITTKAAFDTAVQPLIDAAVSAKAAEFEGWLSPEAHQQALDALKNEHKSVMLKSYREKAVLMTGLAPELADRLNGDTEEDIRKDAEQLAAITKGFGTHQNVLPNVSQSLR